LKALEKPVFLNKKPPKGYKNPTEALLIHTLWYCFAMSHPKSLELIKSATEIQKSA
jgi:hypothetical protein